MNRKYLRLAASLIIAPASLAVMAEITLPPLLTDNMVIQRDTEAPSGEPRLPARPSP